MHQSADAYNDKRRSGANSPSDDAQADPDFTHNVGMRMSIQLQFLVPSETQAVDSSFSSLQISLFWPDLAMIIARERVMDDAAKAKAMAKLPPAPPLLSALHLGSHRAVLGYPRTARDVDALIAAMQKLGLNQLDLDVFSDGVSHIATSSAQGTDILTEALARTRGTGIAVYADLSLLNWGDAPPESVQDLTIDGRTNREAAIEENKTDPKPHFDEDGLVPFTAPPVRVSPAAVGATLAALVRDLSIRPGLAGQVWENADPDSDLGYTPAMRLAFLRSVHADPQDITLQAYLKADVTLPLFDDAAVDTAVNALWEKAQTQSSTGFLQQLSAAAQRSSNTLPILMEQRWNDHLWYASWDNPKSAPPPLRELSFDGDYDANEAALKGVTRAQGRIVLRRELIRSDGDTTALARKLQDDAKTLSGDGFVLDFKDDAVTQGAAPLDSLVRAVLSEKTVK